jgi:transposase-like protein
MPERRRRFSPQFKAEAVQMVLETGRSIAEVARDLGIHDGTLGNWVNAWRREHPEPAQPLTPVERVHVKELEDEIRRLRMENEFLKKAAASSTGQRNIRGRTCAGGVAGGQDRSAGDVGRAEARGVAAVETGSVAQRDRAGSGKGSGFDTRCRQGQRRVHTR